MESNLKTRGKDRRRLSEAALFSASGVYGLGLRWVWDFGVLGGFAGQAQGVRGLGFGVSLLAINCILAQLIHVTRLQTLIWVCSAVIINTHS